MLKQLKSPALSALAVMVLPFLVGFDVPDSSGLYVNGGAGRGAYHASGCHREYDFQYEEARLAFRKTYATAPKDGARGWARLRPDFFTWGIAGDITRDHLVLLQNDSQVISRDSLPGSDVGFMGNIHVAGDWKWLGMNLGLAGLDLRRAYREGNGPDLTGIFPSGGLRLGPEWLYASGEVFAAGRALTSGGGYVKGGIGGRFKSTRLWAGVGIAPYERSAPIIDVSQRFGSLAVSLTAMGNGMLVPPSGQGIDHEYGLSLGFDYRIPGL